MMDLKRKSHAGPMPCTIKTRWSTFSGSPGNTQMYGDTKGFGCRWYTLHIVLSYIPSVISTEMFSTPLLTVRGRVCSEGEVNHSSCIPIGWYCIISWARSKEMKEMRTCEGKNNEFIRGLALSFIQSYFTWWYLTVGLTLGLCKITVSPVGNSSFVFHSSKVTAII